MTEEEKYMLRCIQLARNGICRTAPNPMVGAVIVCDGKIIGEGYHVCCGEAHAEVRAIRSVKEAALLKRSTLYVSLEPCSHYGKTPPCADLIIEKQIPRVVIGCKDPFAKVDGQGIEKLRKAGIAVTVGVYEKECHELISRFLTFHTLHRPYILLKWAESADGFIDINRTGGTPVKLSTPLTSLLAHKRRAEADAILVGTHTALLDNPSLTTRFWYGKNPVRLVIDKERTLPKNLHLFDETRQTLVFTETPAENRPQVEYIETNFNQNILPQLFDTLYQRGLQTLLVEGGSILLQSFIDQGLWDDIYIEKTRKILGEGVEAPLLPPNLPIHIENHFGTPLFHYRNPEKG